MKSCIRLTLLCLFALCAPLQAQDQELLPPEQAFQLSAWMENGRLIAEYRIAPGYYMYRERFKYEIEASDQPAVFGTPQMRDGKIKQDEFFGETEVYRDQLRVSLPLRFDAKAATSIQVKATGQGCADIGVCYPPLKQSLAMQLQSSARVQPTAWSATLAVNETSNVQTLQSILNQVTTNFDNNQQSQSATVPASGNAIDLLTSLGAEIGLDDDEEILHPDQAFILSAKLDANNVIQSNIRLANNIYLYLDKVAIDLIQGDGHQLGPIALPKGKKKVDEFLGPTEVIYHQLNVSIPIISAADASDKFTLAYRYQGCVEDRICYPPITKYISVDAPSGLLRVSANAPSATGKTTLTATDSPISEQDQFAQLLNDESLLLIIGLFFIAGIGLTFTPCVFPMIPILSGIIAGQGSEITTRKAFWLSLVYVLSMASTYAIAGAIVGYYGAEFNIQIWFQDPIILGGFAIVFVLLALSMFGFYDLQMPSAIQTRLASFSNSQEGGSLIGVGLMGLLSAIIVGPCITAPLVGALIFISQTQDWQLGGLALFALGLGMGVPLMLVGTSAGKLLPRAGAWMDAVKSVFGVMLLGVAIWLLERVLPVGITMALIAALLIGSAIYMGALDSFSDSVSGWKRFNKSLGLLILIYGAAYLIGAAAGSKDLIQPLRGLSLASGGSANTEAHLVFRQIKGRQGLQLALNDSVQQGRESMLDFYADWCISCKEMEKYAFTHPGVLAALEQVSTLQADVTDNDSIDTELMTSLGIYGPPAILFFDASGDEIRNRRVVGEMSGDQFAKHVTATFQ